jgi:hypothetical protein
MIIVGGRTQFQKTDMEKNSLPLSPKSRMKSWSKKPEGEDAWTMFKVQSEFVQGFETLNEIGPCVSIFGSARTQPENPYYIKGVEVARLLTEEGYGVITGGGPGIMEAANKGARMAGGKSAGIAIKLPFEKGYNDFVDEDKVVTFKYFFVRKVMFVKYAQAFVVLPGGFGTLDELFEVLTLVQTQKISEVPVILIGEDFWGGMLDWIQKTVLEQFGNIGTGDLDRMPLTDDPEEAVEIINRFYRAKSDQLGPNYQL